MRYRTPVNFTAAGYDRRSNQSQIPSFAVATRHNHLMGPNLSGVNPVNSSRKSKCHPLVKSAADETPSGAELPYVEPILTLI
jgi:hypothetical protein